MKLSNFLLVGTLIAAMAIVSAPVAKADSLPPGDPRIQVGGAMIDDPTPIFTQDFSIVSPSGSSPATSPCLADQGAFVFTAPGCQFLNVINPGGTGQPIDQMIFDFPTVDAASMTCGNVDGAVVVFTNPCSISPDGFGGTLITFSGGLIPFDSIFSITMDGFDEGTTGGVIANTPEPGTLLLLLVGFVALLVGVGLKRMPVRVQ